MIYYKNLSRKNKRRYIVAVIVVVSFCIWYSLKKYYRRQELMNCSKTLTEGFVYRTNFIYLKSTGLWTDYEYKINQKSYTSTCNIGVGFKDTLKLILLHKKFPIAYCRSNPENSTILITPKQYEEYGYSFPDSLKWILDYK